MAKIARYARAVTGKNKLCLAGGVALNCVSNGKLVRAKLFDDIWVQPAAGDAGAPRRRPLRLVSRAEEAPKGRRKARFHEGQPPRPPLLQRGHQGLPRPEQPPLRGAARRGAQRGHRQGLERREGGRPLTAEDRWSSAPAPSAAAQSSPTPAA